MSTVVDVEVNTVLLLELSHDVKAFLIDVRAVITEELFSPLPFPSTLPSEIALNQTGYKDH